MVVPEVDKRNDAVDYIVVERFQGQTICGHGVLGPSYLCMDDNGAEAYVTRLAFLSLS
jgi:hypothetical protein